MKVKTKTLKDWFNERNSQHPELGAYINLCYTIHHSGAERKEITKAFNDLIPKDQYDQEDKKELINYLILKAQDSEQEYIKEKAIKKSGQILHSTTPYIK